MSDDCSLVFTLILQVGRAFERAGIVLADNSIENGDFTR